MRLPGPVGVWSAALRFGDHAEAADAAGELEHLGYTALWIPGGVGGDVLGDARRLLDATEHAMVATGILNVWMHDPEEVAAGHRSLTADHPGRFLLGLGVSHASLVDSTGQTYERPMAKVTGYLDRLDGAGVPVGERALAALGPRMLALSAARSAGAHPYLVTPDHTARARQILGAGPLLAPEQKVVLDTDPERARATARAHLAVYLGLPNYTGNLRRLGFGDEDLAAGGSDRLVDGIVAWGDDDAIADRVGAHLDAGADHVCIQVLGAGRVAFPRAEWRALAPALIR